MRARFLARKPTIWYVFYAVRDIFSAFTTLLCYWNSSMFRATRLFFSLILLALCLSGAACTIGPDYKQPALTQPQAYTAQMEGGLQEGDAELKQWWSAFKDSTLSSLISRGMQSNLEIREALHRIQEARAQRGVAKAGAYPTLDLGASFSRTQSSENTAVPAFDPKVSNEFALPLEASWEIDFWGGQRRVMQSSTARLQAYESPWRMWGCKRRP